MLDSDPGILPAWLDRVWSRRALWLRADVLGALAVAVVLILGAALWWLPGAGGSDEPPPRTEDALPPATPAPVTTEPEWVLVHAAGAVSRPGLYRLPADARVADLLEAAGGVVAGADLDRLNLAAPLVDGAQLLVPRRGEPGGGLSSGDGVGSPADVAGPVDLNRAGATELETLPGVGPATAAAIIAHRERDGPFAVVDDLLDVRGIGPAKLDAVRDLVVVG